MTDTNHTDSVEISDLTDIAIEVWNQNCNKSAPEAMRAVVTALQATQSKDLEIQYNAGFRAGYEQCVKNQSQQVEEAVRKERENIGRIKVGKKAYKLDRNDYDDMTGTIYLCECHGNLRVRFDGIANDEPLSNFNLNKCILTPNH